MRTEWLAGMVCALVMSQGALGQQVNYIFEWGGAPSGYSVNQNLRQVTITAPGTYKFQANLDGTPGAGSIDWIKVLDPIAGDVHLTVATRPADGGGSGAVDLDQLDLSQAANGIVDELWVSNDLGADGNIFIDELAGDLVVERAILNPMYIGVLDGDLEAALAKDLYITASQVHDGSITVSGCSYSDTIDINGSLAGTITLANTDGCEGLLLGDIDVEDDLGGLVISGGGQVHGTVAIGGDLGNLVLESVESSGRVTVSGTLDTGTLVYLRGPATLGAIETRLWITAEVASTGDLVVSNALAGTLRVFSDIDSAATIQLASVAQTGEVRCQGETLGEVLVLGDVAGEILFQDPLRGECVIQGSVLGTGAVRLEDEVPNTPLRLIGTIEIQGDLCSGGEVSLGAIELDGGITIGDDLAGSLTLADTAATPPADLDGYVIVGGDLTGTLAIQGEMSDRDGDLTNGFVAIDGGLSGSVSVRDGMAGSTEFIAVNYDGAGGEEWDPSQQNGVIQIGGSTYYAPSSVAEAAGAWEVSCLKGDMDNSGTVNAGDIDPFVLALSNPTSYNTTNPGLSGSRVYHGDMNGDDAFNAADNDPFTLRLTDPTTYYATYTCEDCGRGGSLGGRGLFPNTPTAVAQAYQTHVAPAHFQMALDVIEDCITQLGSSPRARFWSEVLALLQK